MSGHSEIGAGDTHIEHNMGTPKYTRAPKYVMLTSSPCRIVLCGIRVRVWEQPKIH